MKKYSENVKKAAKTAKKTTNRLFSPTTPDRIADGVTTRNHTSTARIAAPNMFVTTSFPFNLDAVDTMPTAYSNLSRSIMNVVPQSCLICALIEPAPQAVSSFSLIKRAKRGRNWCEIASFAVQEKDARISTHYM